MKKKPNILWIMTDQQSFNMLSCAGNPHVHTPNMDVIARQGVRFTRAYCSNPVCAPSRLSLFTGLYPSAVGLDNNDARKKIPTGRLPDTILENGFGKLMKQAGYRAVYGGKEHLPASSAHALGFDYICSDERDHLAQVCADYLADESDERPYFMVASFINPHDICFMAISDNAIAPEDVHLKTHYPVENATMRQAQQPPEGVSPEDFFEKICPPLPENYLPADDEPEAITIMQAKRMFKWMSRKNYTDRDWRLHRYTYARLTELVDRQIGQVLAAAQKRGDFDRTVVIFTSDHGDMDASHKLEHKTTLYEECCKIPLLIKGVSGRRQGTQCGALVSNGLDLMPTVLDYAGAEIPGYLQGISLRPILEGDTEDTGRDHVIIESEYGIAAVDKQAKYAQYNIGARAEQYYDFATNPHEQFNQLQEPHFAPRREALRQAVEEWKRRQSHQLP
jgi:arylsulfatase A-like enzyme